MNILLRNASDKKSLLATINKSPTGRANRNGARCPNAVVEVFAPAVTASSGDLKLLLGDSLAMSM